MTMRGIEPNKVLQEVGKRIERRPVSQGDVREAGRWIIGGHIQRLLESGQGNYRPKPFESDGQLGTTMIVSANGH